jgi:enoyl-CoA hydratase
MYENIILEKKEQIAIVTMNRPKSMNALNTDVLNELMSAFSDIRDDDSIRVAIITGEGKAFIAGADIEQMKNLAPHEGRGFTIHGQEVMKLISSIEKPIIAAVNGYALGGGCELAMSCDVIFASDKAKFGQPEVNLGLIPGYGGTQLLPRLIGEKNAKYLIFGGEIINAEEAYRLGLIQKIFSPEELLEKTKEYAELILTKAPLSVKMSKVAINNGLNMDLKTGIAFEAEAYVSAFCSEDRVEGMTAFTEKREPQFKNK